MPTPDTTKWEEGRFFGKCDTCKEEPVRYRKFYYPTFMKGDAECLSSLCQECYRREQNV